METWRRGWKKKHIGCGGIVQARENMDDTTHHEWDLYCIMCGSMLMEEQVEFEKRDEESKVEKSI